MRWKREFQEERNGDFPGGPVKACLITGQGTKIPHAVLHGQKKKKKETVTRLICC